MEPARRLTGAAVISALGVEDQADYLFFLKVGILHLFQNLKEIIFPFPSVLILLLEAILISLQ